MPRELERIQRWMQAVVVHPGTVEEALASPGAAAEHPPERLASLVRPSWSMAPAERVGVYHRMYLARMSEALGTDYPVLRHVLGGDEFLRLVTDYVQAHPSRSYTLDRLGDHLPKFLATWEGPGDAAFLADLARFELAMTEVFNETESPRISAEDLQALDPAAWERLRLVPIAALRLLHLGHEVIAQLEAYHDGRPAPPPQRGDTRIVLHRRDDRVLHRRLSRDEFELLQALVRGTPLAEAIELASQMQAARDQETLFRWFRDWIAAGFFTAVEL